MAGAHSKNELLIPFKSPPLPVRGVVGTDIDRCITLAMFIKEKECPIL